MWVVTILDKFSNLTLMVLFRLSTNSSVINIFTLRKHDYEVSLKNSGYKNQTCL